MIEYAFPTPLFEGLRVTRIVNTCRGSATVSYRGDDGVCIEETILPQHDAGSVKLGYGSRSRVLVVFEQGPKPGQRG